jgi:hypothetical protein
MQASVSPWRVLIKAVLLFAVLDATLVWLLPSLEPPSLYAALNLKRERFPLSTVSPVDNALDVGNLDAMFAAHAVSDPKQAGELRVLVLGDSASWGIGLEPDQVTPGQLNSIHLKCGAKDVRVYNLSFPRSSATKDLMILSKAMAYQPDMIVWFVTWYTLMPKTRIDHFLVTQNPVLFYELGHRFDFLPRGYEAPSWWDTIVARNRALFRAMRFQMYLPIQLATGQDQIPGVPEELPDTLSSDVTFEGLKPPTLSRQRVSLDQVHDFYELADGVPVLIVNEPIQIVSGVPNSDVRYNSYYPRWVYDQYREFLGREATASHWNYLDLWNAFPASYFTGTPLHMNPDGQRLLAETIAPSIEKACP